MKKAFLQKRSKYTFMCIFISVSALLTLCGCNAQNENENNEEQTKVVCDSHSMGSWYTHSQPDCSKEGEERRECSVCGEYEQRSTDKLSSHLYSNGKCAVCQAELTADTDVLYISDGIVRYAQSSKEHLVIPDTYDGKPVRGIEGEAFSACKSLKYVTLPVSLEFINGGFQKCGELCEIFIGENVKEISGSAFAVCNKLSRMVVAKENEHFYSEGNCIISRKGALVAGCNFSILTPESKVTAIDYGAFHHRDDLRSIIIPDSVTKISEHAFSNCYNLEAITLPASLTRIDASAFAYCTSLKSINIPKNVTFIGIWAFDNCRSLTNAEFENKDNWYASKKTIAVTTPIIAADNLTKEYAGYNWTLQK